MRRVKEITHINRRATGRIPHILIRYIVSIPLALMLLIAGAPVANAVIYDSSGMPTAKNTYYRSNYSSSWNVLLTASDTAWNNIPEVTYRRTTNMGEKNAMFVGTYPFNDWFGLYDPSGSGSRKVFTIYINSRRINDEYRKNCSSCWQNFVKSVTVHELGHGLSLANDPQAPGKPEGYYLSIMDTGRPRNSMIVPQSFDRQNVSAKY